MSAHDQLKGAKPARPHTNRKGGYRQGEHLVVCDRSGQIYDSDNVRVEWNGLIVGKDEWEVRHPQEFRRGIREDIAVKDARPGGAKLIDLATTLSDVTAVSGGIVGGVYTSGAISAVRPFVFWTVDLGDSYDLVTATLAGLAMSGMAPPLIKRAVRLGHSVDGVNYTDVMPPIGDFDGGIQPAGQTYVVTLNKTAQHLRLALTGGRGFDYNGAVSQTGLTITRDV